MPKPNSIWVSLDQNILSRFDQLDDAAVIAIPAAGSSLQRIPQIGLDSCDSSDRASDRSPSDSGATNISQTGVHRIVCKDGDIWVSGASLLCACPDCTAPMTVLIWLQLADCWRCQSSISLTEEQYLAARKLESIALPKPSRPARLRAPTSPSFNHPIERPGLRNRLSRGGAQPLVDSTYDPRERELKRLSRSPMAARIVRGGLRSTPAWMVSFLLHLIVILILALIVLGDKSYLPTSITLSTFLSSQREPGGEIRFENPLDALQDDLALANKMDIGDKELRKILQNANRDANELQIDPQPMSPRPDINQIKSSITTPPDKLMSFAARDPRVRAEIVRKEGGTTITEAAVARGIRWLAFVQNKDGGWSLRDYRKHYRDDNESDIMGTSLALLPMLGAGQTHEFGAYKKQVSAGLAWMIDHQKSDGDLRAGFKGQAGMYAHGQGAIVLCEALALTGDQKLRDPAQRAIRFIELAQHEKGGWRYRPHQTGDTSVFGWQMMALQSARSPDLDLEVDDATLRLADYFLEQVTAPAKFDNRRKTRLPEGAAYCYQPGRPATEAMTAEAILCRMYLGWKKDDPRLSSAVRWLIQDHLPSARDPNLYYWYYGTQVMHHYGGQPWEIWNNKMRSLLIASQETRGSYPGSWDPKEFEWGPKGGRIYTTSLAVCTLEVYYRHLPLFKQIELDD